MGRLDGKVAIITGASTGCGPVMAKLFIEQGARVLLAARREELVLEAAKAAGDGAIGMRVDVTKEDDIRAMVERAMQEFGADVTWRITLPEERAAAFSAARIELSHGEIEVVL